ncbi:Putative protein [Zobellia galactanivorans]|uniref:Uncharacterized protein n=1 Tax=Zobellia galactanivorans (strain DSM 12802 / CCUG 47099 / CIP 106680 / NCIMB 13871 / Dsij) TaxID=63186 RepID=G0L6K4_ZOBGA|nr:Putative protein [Zobellia galactanivorans]
MQRVSRGYFGVFQDVGTKKGKIIFVLWGYHLKACGQFPSK